MSELVIYAVLGAAGAYILGPRLAALCARAAIWMVGRKSGPDPLYADAKSDEGRIERRGRARTALAPRGKVFVSGEVWDAEAESPVAAGEPVEVLSREGLLLRVRAAGPTESPVRVPSETTTDTEI